MRVRDYRPQDERGWVECRTLAFLDTAYYDDVHREKERYEHRAVQLVAEEAGTVVGLLDLECEDEPGTVCLAGPGRGAMIWHVAVLRAHRRRGIGTALLREAERQARSLGIERLEAWTRDDRWVRRWYEAQGFRALDSYLHVFVDADGPPGAVRSTMEGLLPVVTFAHYVGPDGDEVRRRFRRVHECVLYGKALAGGAEAAATGGGRAPA